MTRALSIASLFVAALLASCEEERVLLGADLCAASDCGVELAVPARACADGTTAGYTGRCMRDEALTACHWEILDCAPLPECEAADCGQFPIAYTAGVDESVECRRAMDGTCQWTVMELPGCEPADCGVVPESAGAFICPGGELGGFTGACIIGPDGECTWEEAPCTEPPVGSLTDMTCSLEECGQQPSDARIACTDGTAAGNTERCIRVDADTCEWEVRTCAPPVECASNADCGETEFCDRSAVACNTSIRGMCSLRPTECPTYLDAYDRRVCACDGLTYESACEAQILGVSVASDGPCE